MENGFDGGVVHVSGHGLSCLFVCTPTGTPEGANDDWAINGEALPNLGTVWYLIDADGNNSFGYETPEDNAPCESKSGLPGAFPVCAQSNAPPPWFK